MHAAGTEAQIVETLPLHAIDRSPHIGVLSSAYLPPLGPGGAVESLLDVIARARSGDAAGSDDGGADGDVNDGFDGYSDGEDICDDDEDDCDSDGGGDGYDDDGRLRGGGAGERECTSEAHSGQTASGRMSGGGFGEDSVWLSVDHTDVAAVAGLQGAAAAAAAAAAADAGASAGTKSPDKMKPVQGPNV